MTNRERAERFWIKDVSPNPCQQDIDNLAAEFDAVAREAAAQMRERCTEIVARHIALKNPDPSVCECVVIAEAIRALPLTEEGR